jgi:hypothetical protein
LGSESDSSADKTHSCLDTISPASQFAPPSTHGVDIDIVDPVPGLISATPGSPRRHHTLLQVLLLARKVTLWRRLCSPNDRALLLHRRPTNADIAKQFAQEGIWLNTSPKIFKRGINASDRPPPCRVTCLPFSNIPQGYRPSFLRLEERLGRYFLPSRPIDGVRNFPTVLLLLVAD